VKVTLSCFQLVRDFPVFTDPKVYHSVKVSPQLNKSTILNLFYTVHIHVYCFCRICLQYHIYIQVPRVVFSFTIL
jgi:hypothetical protein